MKSKNFIVVSIVCFMIVSFHLGFFISRDTYMYVTLHDYTAQELQGITVQVGGYTQDGTELYVFPMDTLELLDEDTFIWRDAWIEAAYDGKVDIVVKRYDEELHATETNLYPFLGRFLNNHITFNKVD